MELQRANERTRQEIKRTLLADIRARAVAERAREKERQLAERRERAEEERKAVTQERKEKMVGAI